MAVLFLTERENEHGKSGLVLFEKRMSEVRAFMSNLWI
jgi:hypothetical protein